MLVLSGDLTDHGDRDSFEKTAALLSVCPSRCTRWSAIMTHGTNCSTRSPDTPTQGGFVHYAVEHEGLRIIFLDTLEPGRHGGAFCEARRDWLASELTAHPATPTLIFMHHPPVVAGIGWMDPGADEAWMPTFRRGGLGPQPDTGDPLRPSAPPDSRQHFAGIPASVTPSVAPLVAMDLRRYRSRGPRRRDLITTEPPTYALHRWENGALVTHYETVNDWEVLASYGEHCSR